MSEATVGERLMRAFTRFGVEGADPTRELLAFFADDAVFEDPFQTIRGKARIEKAFTTMERAARAMRIEAFDLAENEGRVWFAWRFVFEPRRGPALVVLGATLFELRAGRVVRQRDYWDTLESLAASFPALPRLVRGLVGRGA